MILNRFLSPFFFFVLGPLSNYKVLVPKSFIVKLIYKLLINKLASGCYGYVGTVWKCVRDNSIRLKGMTIQLFLCAQPVVVMQ
jgi:hypothetical protein